MPRSVNLARSSDMRTELEAEACRRALAATEQAFAPISGFAVGACIVSADGHFFVGQNQETLAFNALHAEIAALKSWNEAGCPPMQILAVVGFRFWPTVDKEVSVTPCGECRQWIYEASLRSKSSPKIICCNGALTKMRTFHIHELLPSAFEIGSDDPFADWSTKRSALLRELKSKP